MSALVLTLSIGLRTRAFPRMCGDNLELLYAWPSGPDFAELLVRLGVSLDRVAGVILASVEDDPWNARTLQDELIKKLPAPVIAWRLAKCAEVHVGLDSQEIAEALRCEVSFQEFLELAEQMGRCPMTDVWTLFPVQGPVRTVQHDRCESKTARGNVYANLLIASRAAVEMSKATGDKISAYKCSTCSLCHIGRDRCKAE